MSEETNKTNKVLKKALLGVCKDLDAMFETAGQSSTVTKDMKERLIIDEEKVLAEILEDQEIKSMMDE